MCVHMLKVLILLRWWYYPKGCTLSIQSLKIPMACFCRNRRKHAKMHKEFQVTWNSQNVLKVDNVGGLISKVITGAPVVAQWRRI